jgi:hypothetical protein
MTISQKRGYHLEVQRLINKGNRQVDAYAKVESEYVKSYGKPFYLKYNTFRMNHWRFIKSL